MTSEIDTSVLIVTSLLDFPTDRVCDHLTQLGTSFLRINREQLTELAITIDPINAKLSCNNGQHLWSAGSNLKSIYWRQPTFLRNTPAQALTTSEQLQRSQWSALMRGLMFFDDVLWMNHPAATYRAESKPLQLRTAAKVGFKVPETRITNDRLLDIPSIFGEKFALKSIDTILLYTSKTQHFGYTTISDWHSCNDDDFHLVPATCQKLLSPKIDLRVTLVGSQIWCDKISDENYRIEGDWRLLPKTRLKFEDYKLPSDVQESCFRLLRKLGLRFGAIDLAIHNGEYWFIELNPTGEWGWLDREGRGISRSISEELACSHLSQQ